MQLIKKIIAAGFVLSVILIIVGFVSGGSTKGVIDIIKSDKYYVKQENIKIEDTRNLTINVDSRKVVIVEGESNYIEYFLEENREIVKYENNSFSIKRNNKNVFNWFNYGFPSEDVRTIKIYLEKDLIHELNINIISGSLEINGNLSFENLNIKVISGRTNLKKIKINNELNVTTESGSVYLENIETDKLSVTAESGRATIKNAKVEDGYVEVTSGNIVLEKIEGLKLNVKARSGNIVLKNLEVAKTEVKVISGRVKVTESKDKSEVAFIANVKSGYIKYYGQKKDYLNDQVTNQKYIYTINTTSGNIIITKWETNYGFSFFT